MSDKKLFVGGIAASRVLAEGPTGLTVSVAINIFAGVYETLGQAEQRAKEVALERWGIDCGWRNHISSLMSIDDIAEIFLLSNLFQQRTEVRDK